VIRFDDVAAARAYMGLAVDLQRKQDELLNAACDEGGRVVESRSLSMRLHGIDEAARSDKRLQSRIKGRTISVSQIWLRADDRILEFSWTEMEPDMAWTQRVVDCLTARPR
jgi:hypothetical protein